MTQCSILYVRANGEADGHPAGLRALGFHVDACRELPPSDGFTAYHAVVIRPDDACYLPMLAARLRAKPRFGRRILLALLDVSRTERAHREAVLSGFDLALPDTCGARDLAAAILRLLRPYPEYRCLLRSPSGRRKAA